MWVAHTEDNYLTKPGNGASYIERIRTAYRFGVSESKPAIATLLNDRINVDSTIDTYTEVEGASDLFDEIQAQLVFDKNLGLWRLP
jgi:hypothetical protein